MHLTCKGRWYGSSHIVARSQVFTHHNVLKARSMVAVVTGKAKDLRTRVCILGKNFAALIIFSVVDKSGFEFTILYQIRLFFF